MTFTYDEVGATRGAQLPSGYNHLNVQTDVGRGADVFRRAAEAVMTFRMHRAIPVGFKTSLGRAEAGLDVTVILAFVVKAPARMVWTIDEERKAGWAYGTLPGHPECGEELFLIEHLDDDSVRLTVSAFSRPAHPVAKLGGPLVPVIQRLYAQRCGQVLRKLSEK